MKAFQQREVCDIIRIIREMTLEALRKMSSRGKEGTAVLLGESIVGFTLILERDLTGLK